MSNEKKNIPTQEETTAAGSGADISTTQAGPQEAKAEEEKPYFVKFRKPYTFEGKEYEGMDLSGLEDLTSEDLFEVNKLFQTRGYITPRPEADIKYCCMVAAIAAGVPDEFFINLPAKEGMKVRNEVQTFFQSED